MLTTFVPVTGIHSGVSYTLPYVENRTIPILHYKDGTSALAHQDGRWMDGGAGSAYIDYAEIDAVFLFGYDWLIARSYGATEAGLHTALTDFGQYVVQGGNGTWTDTLATGTKVNGATVTSRTFTGRLYSDVTPEYMSSAPTAPACKLHATIIIGSGLATYNTSPATTIPLFF